MRQNVLQDIMGFGLVGGMMLFYFGLFFLVVFGVIYLLNRIQASRMGRREPMLGGQVVCGMLLSASLQIITLAVAMGLYLFFEEREFEDIWKATGGFLLGGLLSGLYPFVVYFARLHWKGSGRVFRQGLGLNAIITGMVFVVAVTAGMVMVVNETPETTLPFSITIVYLVVHLGCSLPLLSEKSSFYEDDFAEE